MGLHVVLWSISGILVEITKQSREMMLKLHWILRKWGEKEGWCWQPKRPGKLGSTFNSEHTWVIQEPVWISSVGRAITGSMGSLPNALSEA